MENKILYHFKTRFDLPLYNAIIKLAKEQNIPVYRLVQKALKKLLEDYSNGLTNINELSDFLQRNNTEKKEYYAIFNHESKERMRRLAFTFYKSQAEILRIALEYYVYALYKTCGENVCAIYQQKNRHVLLKAEIGIVIYELFTVKTHKIRMLNKTKPYKLQFL